ncbi:hypothetical protein [Prescottella agglutinans]|uniref:Uncharacterized protein n=1 Tax=Prescottella agglutinans TaxID=1644129 RepID=A0ABT6MFB9_9NOCA|nr:hypothetical protein [Prescottella agglutinans]MDH6282590.1 hypothetical protein [Prescottella agglutinans]
MNNPSEVDRIVQERRGCNYSDLTLDEARGLLYEMCAEVEVKEAYIRILEEQTR